jgi:hypothetical protein
MKSHFKREGMINVFILALPLLILIVGAILITGYRVFHLQLGARVHPQIHDGVRKGTAPQVPH